MPYYSLEAPLPAPWMDVEKAATDWDGWMQTLDEEKRAEVDRAFTFSTPETLQADRKRFISVAFVAQDTGIDAMEISTHFENLYQPLYANQVLGKNELGVGLEPFFNEIVGRKKKAREEMELVAGYADESREGAGDAWKGSLVFFAREAAYARQTYGHALGAWQQQVVGKSGYDDRNIGKYVDIVRTEFDEMTRRMDKARPVGQEAFNRMASAYGRRELGKSEAMPYDLFRGLDGQEKELAFRVMKDLAEGADDKGLLQATGEGVGRAFEKLYAEGGSAAWRDRVLQHAAFKEGDLVIGKDAEAEISGGYWAESMARMSGGTGGAGAGYARSQMPRRALSKKEADDWNQQVSDLVEDIDTAEQLRQFGRDVVDPIKGGGWFRRKLWQPLTDSSAIIASLAIPSAWAPAVEMGARSYQNEGYMRYRSMGMSAREANRLGFIEGVSKAALDKLQFGILTRGVSAGPLKHLLPNVTRSLEKFALGAGAGARFSANFFGTMIAETGVELVQDHVIPALVQDNLAVDPRFDVRWAEVWKEAAAAAPDVALGMVLLSGFGAAVQTRGELGAVSALGSSPAAMRLRGYSLEQIDQIIRAQSIEEKGRLLAQHLPLTPPEGEARTQLVADVVRLAAQEREDFKAKSEGGSRLEAAGMLPTVRQVNESIWRMEVRDDQGGVTSSTDFSSLEQADEARRNFAEASGIRLHETAREYISTADRHAGIGAANDTTLRDEAESVADAVVTGEGSRDAAERRLQTSETAGTEQKFGRQEDTDFEVANAAMAVASEQVDDRLASNFILGKNKTEFRDNVYRTSITLNKNATADTIIEEKVKGDASRLIAQGKKGWMISRLRSYEAVSGDRIFRTPDDAQLLDEDVQEAWSHFAISYWAGRSKMDAALPESWKARGSRQVMTDVLRSRMGGVMTGYATFFNAVFRRAARNDKLQREGRVEADLEGAVAEAGETAAMDGGITAEGSLQGEGGPAAPGNAEATAGAGAAAVVGREVQPRLSFSRNSGGRGLVKRFVKLAELEERFRRGGPFQARAPEVDPEKLLREVVAHHALTPDEATVDKWPSPMKPEISASFTIGLKGGGEAYLHIQDGMVWLDTQGVWGPNQTGTPPQLDENGRPRAKERELSGGDLVYQSALSFARSKGLQFAPDPREISDKAKRRRISHMASSALRYGTTRHINPKFGNSRDSVADGWREETTPADDEHNMELLLREELKWVTEEMANMPAHRAARYKREDTTYKSKVKEAARKGEPPPPPPVRPAVEPEIVLLEDLRYEPESDTVVQKQKGPDGSIQWKRLSEGDFAALVAGLEPRDSGISAATLSRTLVAKSEVEGQGVGSRSAEHLVPERFDEGGVVSGGGGVKLFRLLGPDAKPKELFYSRGQGNNIEDSAPGAHAVQRTGVTQAEVDEALERLRTLPEVGGLVDRLLIVGNRQELDGKDGRPGEADYHAKDWADIETAEGYHDPDTGGTVVLRDQVEVREGETPAVAVARVILHERVGHEGVTVALALDPGLQKRWDRGSALIPAAELEALGKRYPELADRPVDLAFEWLAHRIGDDFSSGKLEPGSVAAQLWQVIKDAVAKFMNRVTGGRVLSDAALDAYAREMAQKARERVRNGDVARARAGSQSSASSQGGAHASAEANQASEESISPEEEDTVNNAGGVEGRLQTPSFIVHLASTAQSTNLRHGTESQTHSGSATGESTSLDPRRVLESLRERAAGRSHSAAEGKRSTTDETVPDADLAGLPQIEASRFNEGLGEAESKVAAEHGQEHDVYFDAQSNSVIKLTEPGKYGVRKSLPGYLEQAAFVNEEFGDRIRVEGWVQMPGEAAPRLVITQPWYRGRPSTDGEIDAYMRRAGYLRQYEGAWWHPDKEVQVTDALPKNFRTIRGGHIRPIDLVIAWPKSHSAIERIENMVYSQAQPAVSEERGEISAPEAGPAKRLQFSLPELETPNASDGSRAPKPPRRARSSQQTTPPQPSLNETLGTPGTPLRTLLDKLGVSDLDTHVFTEVQAQQLVTLLKQDTPPKLVTLVRGITGDKTHSSEQIRTIVEEFASFMPPALARQLSQHPVVIAVDPRHTTSPAAYRPEGDSIAINPKTPDFPTLRRNLFHELVHWAHLKGPSSFRDRVTALASRRTGGFQGRPLILYSKTGVLYGLDVKGFPDDWADHTGNQAAGRVYPGVEDALAVEVPTVHLEKLVDSPAMLAVHLNHRSERTGRLAWREAFLSCLDVFLMPSLKP